jgi:hypothetical protein
LVSPRSSGCSMVAERPPQPLQAHDGWTRSRSMAWSSPYCRSRWSKRMTDGVFNLAAKSCPPPVFVALCADARPWSLYPLAWPPVRILVSPTISLPQICWNVDDVLRRFGGLIHVGIRSCPMRSAMLTLRWPL